MKRLFEKWWCNNTKCFSIINYRRSWTKAGARPKVCFVTCGGKRDEGDLVFDASLILGYTIFSYTNFNLQGHKITP